MVASNTAAFGAISTGATELDGHLGGGIPLGSLTLIEGQSDAGKSVLALHLLHGSLSAGLKVALYTTEDTVMKALDQMASLGMDVSDYFLLDQLRIYPLELSERPSSIGGAAAGELFSHMSLVPGNFQCILVDSLTNLIAEASEAQAVEFFSRCKLLCERGRTIFLVTHSEAFSQTLRIRLSSLCDAHLKLRIDIAGQRLVKTLEVAKIRNAEKGTGNIVTFDVEPGMGIRVVPISKARA